MIKKETRILIAIGALIVVPAGASLLAYAITKNPSLRPLNITYESLSEAGQIANTDEIIAVISVSEHATKASKRAQTAALETAFDRYQASVNVKFRLAPNHTTASVTYLVGKSKLGPYPFSRAASGIPPAVQAERMLKSQQAAVALKAARDQERTHSFWRWARVFN